jgi:ribulose-phosphate 3-epimerase
LRRVKIAPSVLAYDLSDLRGAVEIADRGGADIVHLDVIDGHFAPNITFGAGTIKALRKTSKLVFEAHLMISEPARYLGAFLDAGSDIVVVHAETIDGAAFDALYDLAHSKGKQIGLALKPGTELPGWAEERLDKMKTIIVLTVNPGFSGQKMDVGQFPKIQRIDGLITKRGLDVDIEVDGGIDSGNVGEVARIGGNSFVAGAGVYNQPDPALAIAKLRQNAMAVRSGA